ncbi:MAG: 1-acyl-sn-glycerol-3-phosphate acyltransferase [Saprospiraceae bacterium]|nr:1-acyl-sn-glycerol-3-phosphate acyltransferase [Saprospiraceae bacterium]MCF8249686.1 1-acyl-sn-glycerol-3-phosphate acyltransferase [Saprospiraceae bacterium]MCF8279845.1 1-acyl-sn-glycerol-3-phosphate acyltransferase [Bacteroidales bacterium]MCF8312327.1 1-acyl-sn-glycerol-3-phosphate acyltransferase [Saprospiraceae bacterium]MCF8440676.1 1-acyl-sn-glycerol-3-phosphate acyltransferase [Saprospiraceae bacterium]
MNISHQERIPQGKPVILAANHPTAFIEPCILGCWQSEPLHFLARGDLYVKKPFVRKLYDWFHIVPVFRLDDMGYGGLKSNYESFGKCFEVLNQNKQVMILAEGRTKHEKRLRPLMKGTARIVFGTLEKYPDLDIQVVPVGVNFTNPDQFRSDVSIDYGEPIRVQDYAAIYFENPAKGVAALTQALKKRLSERVIHLAHPEDDEWTEPLLEMHRNGPSARLFPSYTKDPTPLFEEKKLADRLNHLSEVERQSWKEKIGNYLNLLRKAGTSDRGLMDHTSYSLGSALVLGLGWIPYMIGYLLNFLPIYLGNLFAKKKTKNIEFRASVAIFVSMVFYFIYWLICLTLALVIGKLWLIGLVVAMPILGYFAVAYHDLDVRWKDCQRAAVIDDATEEKLLKMRAELMEV